MSDTISPEDLIAALSDRLPVTPVSFDGSQCRAGLVIVDEINGFATVGAGPLAPDEQNRQVERMVQETDRLARDFVE